MPKTEVKWEADFLPRLNIGTEFHFQSFAPEHPHMQGNVPLSSHL